MQKTIQDLQSDIEAALRSLLKYEAQLPETLKPLLRLAPPEGSQVHVSFCHAKKGKKERKVKCNAPWDAWSFDAGLVSISYDELGDETPRTEQARTTQ